MTGDSEYERIEHRISSGLADVFAFSSDDPFPEVPEPTWRDRRTERQPDAELANFVEPYSDIASSYNHVPESSPGVLPSHADLRPSMFQGASLDRDEVASAESAVTLRNSDEDEWFYLEQIASYLDMHQKVPIDVHTGFNYVYGLEATRALGLPELNNEQMMLLMRAGLIVHHYATSISPWRDALGQVEHDIQMEAQHVHEQYRFVKQRLMKQLTSAIECRNRTIVRKYLHTWLEHLARVRESKRKLLVFDEQTLLPPYFLDWRSQSKTISDSTGTARLLNVRASIKSTLQFCNTVLKSRREEEERAMDYAKTFYFARCFKYWHHKARKASNTAILAEEEHRLRLRNQYFSRWKTLRIDAVFSRRCNQELVKTTLNQWRLKLAAKNSLRELAVKTRSQLLIRQWSRRYQGVQVLSNEIQGISISIEKRKFRSILRDWWLESKTRLASEILQESLGNSYMHIWRAHTRLVRFSYLQDGDLRRRYFGQCRAALDAMRILNDKSEQFLDSRDLESCRTLIKVARDKTSSRKNLKATTKEAGELVASRKRLRELRACVERNKNLARNAHLYLLRSLFFKIASESERRKQVRLEWLANEVAYELESRNVANLLLKWHGQSLAHTTELANIGLASQCADHLSTMREWTKALDIVKQLEEKSEDQFMEIAISNAFTKWRLRMSDQINAEIEAENLLSLKRGLLAKRILRQWRRQHSHVNKNLDEWREDANRQLAVIYLRTLQSELIKRRYGEDSTGGQGTINSPQRTPSRRNAISPRALEFWTARAPARNSAPKPDGWGATPLTRRPADVPPRLLSTPTKPSRLMRNLALDPKTEL